MIRPGGISVLEAAGATLLVGGSTVTVGLLQTRRGRAHRLAGSLRESASRTEILFRVSPEPMWVWDAETLRILDANDAASRVLGWTRDELLGMTVTELQVDANPRRLRTHPYQGEWRHRRRDGSTFPGRVATTDVPVEGRPARISIVHDLTVEREKDARTRAVVDSAADAILTLDIDGRIESANPSAVEMFGYGGDELVGTPVANLMESGDGERLERPALALGREVTGRRADGTTFALELSVRDVELSDHTVSTVIARDISERKALERRLTSQATHDALTGLPNRPLLIDRLVHALARAERTGRSLAVLFCDLDRFKVINDSLGHTAGDALLFATAGRFREAVRTADTVARFGGDEFIVLVENLADDTDAVRVAEQLIRSLDEPVKLGPKEIHVTASIGIAVGRPGHDTAEGLVRDADAAMYRAKTGGRARYEMFDADLRRQALARLDIESAMRAGLERDEFVVHYQPELDLSTGRVTGVEALVRWERPEHLPRPPSEFLPVAEETGLIVRLGEVVLHQACAEARRWHADLGDRAPTVWVNISARQLTSLELIPMIEAAARALPRPEALGLEITETDIVPDDDLSKQTMDALVDIGVQLAIDDFGTGFASLSYLWRFPARVVKIDQSFVHRMDGDGEATVLVRAMIEMAHSLGKTIVAEGVETEAQLNLLRDLGADSVQGYLLGRPQPARSIDAILQRT